IYYPNEEYCQIFHQKPIYGGSLARRPAWLVTHYYQVPVLGNLFHERMRFFDAAEADKQLTREFVQRFVAVHNIKYLILTSIPPPFGDKYKLLRSLIESRFPITKQWEEKKFVLYELSRPPADQPLTVDLEQPWGMLYLKRGFGTTGEMGCWATRAEAEMVLPLRGKARKTLRVEMSPFVYPWAPPQTVELTLNGHLLGRATLRPGFAMYEFAIPASALDGSPVSALRFSFGYCVSPAEKGVSEDRRTLAAAVRTVEVVTAKD
ncbi:hypothetical protein FJY63_00485, partial [Candidatus Sumerlaeota bacterium]|nr:hypothetical protein [Candidatus Sumerlaeota bacterium]